ncbi:MAG TPA: helix-turn-helix transcriptional regulator, partial [Tepidiformaceae bacterium]|nr:helix-turn-helix transcriptional regulator [Tepidiformaceae bacterium]
MDAARTPDQFERASHFERQLTQRQKQVLDLIVAGHTNGEIATELGITLDGAKWNVSEILTKLGLADRDEAADYWRWRNRRSRRIASMARGLIGLPALGWATGGAGVAALAIAGFAVFASAAGLGDDTASLDAVVEAGEDPEDSGDATLQPRPGSIEFEAVLASTNPYPNHSGNTESRHTWHAAPGLERCESVLVAPAEEQGPEVTITTTTVVSDDLARRLTATQRDFGSGPGSPHARLTEHDAATAPPFCAGESFARVPIGATLDDVVAGIRERSYADTVVTLEGTATLLDRTVAVVSYSFVREGMPEPGEPTI